MSGVEALSNLGIFFGGVGVLFLGAGLFWFVSEYAKKKKE